MQKMVKIIDLVENILIFRLKMATLLIDTIFLYLPYLPNQIMHDIWKLFILKDNKENDSLFFNFSEYLPDVIEAFQGDDYEYDEYTLEEMYFNQLEEERLAKKRRKKKNRKKYYDSDDYDYDYY